MSLFQIPYSALDRRHENLITQAAETGAGIIIRSSVAQGEPGFGQGDADRWRRFRQADLDELGEAGESRTAFLLRFTLSHPHCHTAIVGTPNPEHLWDNVATAAEGPLSDKIYEEAKKRLDSIGECPEE